MLATIKIGLLSGGVTVIIIASLICAGFPVYGVRNRRVKLATPAAPKTPRLRHKNSLI